jgi:hypothetical protein
LWLDADFECACLDIEEEQCDFLDHQQDAGVRMGCANYCCDKSPEEQTDDTLGYLQFASASINATDVMADPEMIEEKSRAALYVGLGSAGPAITAGSTLLLYEVAIALFIGLDPLFILSGLSPSAQNRFSALLSRTACPAKRCSRAAWV